ncbi:hypothetical protein [Phormidesmis sp. 146-33]
MSLIVYEATREEDIDRRLGEQSELIQFGSLPKLFDLVKMGSDRLWKVVHIEPYYRADEKLYLVMVSRADLTVVDRSGWTANFMRSRSPNLSFDVQLSQDQSVLKYGWSMEGKAPTGRLLSYSPVGEGTLMKANLEPWTIDRTDAYRPDGAGIYTAIHLCWCSPVEVAVAA